jgi:hypothetical protein
MKSKKLVKQKYCCFLFIFLGLVLCNCVSIYTKSGNANWNRTISIKVLSGNVYLDISGHISEDIYFDNNIYQNKQNNNFIDSPVVSQGKETINQSIVLNETQEFRYTLTTAEVVIANIRSIDENDAILIISEYNREKEYTIDGQNKLGQIITFIN